MDSTPGQPDGVSKLCLSCHDGTVALDSYGGVNGSTIITGSALLGTDLSTSHPISMKYDAALASTDGKLWDPTSKDSGLGGPSMPYCFMKIKWNVPRAMMCMTKQGIQNYS